MEPTLSTPTTNDKYSTALRDAMHESPYLKALIDFGENYPAIINLLVRRIPLDLR